MIEHVKSPSGQNGDSRRTRRVIFVIVALVVLILLLLLLLSRCSGDEEQVPPATSPGVGGVTIGTIDPDNVNSGGKDIQTLLNEQVAEGMFQVFIATRIEVDPDGNMRPLIQNAGRNHYHCWVELIDSYGNSVYSSDVIPPGYKIEEDVITPLVSKGLSKCTAVFHILQGTEKDSGEVNSIEVAVDIIQEQEVAK